MAKVSPVAIRQSLETWLPKGDFREFEEAIEGLGAVLGAPKVGFWGKFKSVVNKHYAPAEKKKVMAMAEDIVHFYKAKKSGGRQKEDDLLLAGI